MALSQGQMRIVGAVLAIVLFGGAAGIIIYQMQKPRKVLVVEAEPVAPTKNAAAAPSAPGKPFSGTVVNTDGKPVPGMEVLLVPEGFSFDLNGPRSPTYPATRTDKDGRFDFPKPPTWWGLVVNGDAGFAETSPDQMPADGKIVMRPWGRVEGTYLAGTTPQANQSLTLYPFNAERVVATTNPSNPYRMVYSGGRARMTQRARTDANGHFVFERVAPGAVIITKIIMSGRVGRSSNLTNVQVRPGETTTVQIGGKGRPVIGRAVFDGNDDQLPPINGSIQLMVAAPGARRALVPGPDWAKLSDQERQKQVDEWMATVRQPSLYIAIDVAADGTFRAEDIPEGQHSIRMYSQTMDPGSGTSELAADATVPVVIPAMPGGRSDEPFDAGTIKLKIRPRVKVGSAAPSIEAAKADGTTIKLSDYRGKYVLLSLVEDYGTMQSPQPGQLMSMGTLADRFEDDRIVMLAVLLPQQPTRAQRTIPDIGGWIVASMRDWQGKLDPAYLNSRGSYLISPEGAVLAKLGLNASYGMVDQMLGLMKRHGPGVVVSVEKLTGQAATKAFAFQNIPTISQDDAGQNATFTIVDGRKANFAGQLPILNDGLGPRHDRDELLMLTFDPGSIEGRICADLGKAIDVEAINTYAWYKDSHRWNQVYRVYGSDGAAANFNASPKIGTNPTTCGWTFIADADTRDTPGGTNLRDNENGQSGVNIHGEKGPLGKYRYLLFVSFASETHNGWGQEFWGEIDIVGK